MPRLLKNDSIRLIEASVEALGLAQVGICSFRKDELKIESVRYSAEIGLIGASVELAMNSILIQAFGRKTIYKEERFKTASEILHDFRNFLNQSSAVTLFLTNGISDGQFHIQRLLELTNRFQLMIISRANGLHNGMGLSYEITASFFQEVSKFLQMISQSINYKPYLQKVPELVGISIDKNVLIDDLYNKVNASKDITEQKNLISSLFLILPELPKELPEWISCFERFNIAPKRNDTVYLVNALESANPVSLKKVKTGSQTLEVRVDNNNPNAIPILPQYLKTEFTQFKDQFYADISTANGRLNSKQLDLPPKSSVYKAFSVDYYKTNILSEGTLFTAHNSWPFIVSALNVPKNHANAPFWFMVRKTNDIGQLKAQLRKAAKLGNDSLKNNTDLVIKGIEKIEKNQGVDISEKFYKTIFEERNKFISHLEKFHNSYNANKNHVLGEKYEDLLNDVFDERTNIGELLSVIIEDSDLSSEQRKYWVFQFTQVMPEIEDLNILVEILSMNEYSNSHTNIRKTMRAFDFFLFGPKIVPIPNDTSIK